ncbi:MAG: hypothetical protein EBU90_06405 [Proteobacteria bacterium]|nr:hypothetical protein [Pseudomonadota bacterium]NBP13549.1 hypothetical protein [bacterium]
MPVIKIINKKALGKQESAADIEQSPAVANRILSLYDAVVGSSVQVSTGAASHSSLTSALANISVGGKILILKGSYSENVTVDKKCYIEGQGHSSIITGTFTVSTDADYSTILNLRFHGDLIVQSDGTFVRECFQSTGSITDGGSGNSILVVQG